MASPFVRFLLVGGLNTLFGYALFALLVVFGLPPALALLIATICGVLFNFVTTGRFVFGIATARQLPGFCIVYAIVYAVNAAGLQALMQLRVSAFIAQALLLPLMPFLSFQLMRRFVFTKGAA